MAAVVWAVLKRWAAEVPAWVGTAAHAWAEAAGVRPRMWFGFSGGVGFGVDGAAAQVTPFAVSYAVRFARSCNVSYAS